MNDMPTDHTGGNQWENILGRLDALADQINRTLNRCARIEKLGSGISIAQPRRIIDHGDTTRHFLLLER